MRYEKKIVEAMVAIVFPLLIATVVSVIRYFVRFNRNTAHNKQNAMGARLR